MYLFILCSCQNGGHFEFFCKNCKTQKCLYLENRARKSNFDEIFDPWGNSAEWPSPFSKKKFLTQNGGHFEFSNFSQKLQKPQNTYISQTVLDRVISMKFLTHRVSLQSSYPNLQKPFCLTKNGDHFEF